MLGKNLTSNNKQKMTEKLNDNKENKTRNTIIYVKNFKTGEKPKLIERNSII